MFETRPTEARATPTHLRLRLLLYGCIVSCKSLANAPYVEKRLAVLRAGPRIIGVYLERSLRQFDLKFVHAHLFKRHELAAMVFLERGCLALRGKLRLRSG